MSKKQSKFIPALRYDWLTRLYDPFIRLTTRETVFRRRLVEIASLQTGHRVLDLGCGTGTLALLIQKTYAGAAVFGVDGDLKVLKIAQGKAFDSGSNLLLNAGLVFDLPYPANRFDHVFSTLLFHHLTKKAKQQTLQETLRILKPGGQLYIADWGEPANRLMRILFLLVQLLDGFTTTTDNVKGRLPELIRDAGFVEVHQVDYFNTLFGTLRLTKAVKHL
jgi:ubiquinone/menaquinone biosynthesis C-methylase UbiE